MSVYRRVILTLTFVLLQGARAKWPSVPPSPCSNLFNTYISQTQEIYSKVTFDNDWTGIFDLQVNMSIAKKTDKTIHARRALGHYDATIMERDRIEYYITYPYNHTFPKLTALTFNKKLYCAGPPESGPETTPLYTQSYLKVDVPDSVKHKAKTQSIFQIQININSKNDDGVCGVNFDYQQLVLRGRTTKDGEYPWLVALFYLDENYDFRCAGTLISNKHVITAAHCVRTIRNTEIDKDNLLVVFGKHNIKNYGLKSTIRGARKIFVHPDYEKPSDADVAVIVIDVPVRFNTLIKPICLWDEPTTIADIVNNKGTVVGWGMDETGKRYVNEPRQLEMPVVAHDTCLWSERRFQKLTSNRTFCAGEKDGRIPCTGDSGGGFVMERNGMWKLRGVVSTALADDKRRCDGNNYAVFSDVPMYNKWLISILQDD